MEKETAKGEMLTFETKTRYIG